MAEQKLKKVSLSREVRAAIVVSLLAVFLFGGIMIFANKNEGSQTVVNPSDDKTNVGDNEKPQDPVVVVEKLLKPFNVNAKVERYYFDTSDSAEVQTQSLVEYKGKFTPSTAMEYSYNNTKFDVIAAFSGVVTERKVDPLYGYMVYIKNDDGLTAVYGSLNDVVVNVGDNVKQGEVIAKAGTNTIDASLNNHLHFALTKGNKLVNPNKFYGQILDSIK